MMSLSVSKSSRLISIIKGGKKGTSSNELRGSGTTLNEVRASEDSYSVYQAMMMNVLGSHEQGEDKSDYVTKPPTVRMEKSTETPSTPKVIQTTANILHHRTEKKGMASANSDKQVACADASQQ